MKAKFDSFGRFETPKFILCNPSSKISAYSKVSDGVALTDVVGILEDTSDEELILNFNAVSELNLRLNYVPRANAEDDEIIFNIYKSVQRRRLIFVEGIGYFVITDVKSVFDGYINYKDITAESCELELKNKKIPYIENGTYEIAELFEVLFNTSFVRGSATPAPRFPLWSVVIDIPDERYRTFEELDTNIDFYTFMVENVQDAYECIFAFDLINRRITVYDQNSHVNITGVHLTRDDLIKHLTINENTDNMYTALHVTGIDDLSINAINPLGTSIIYDFTYYLPWLSKATREAVIGWQTRVNNYKNLDIIDEDYYNACQTCYNFSSEKEALLEKYESTNLVMELYRTCSKIVEYSKENKITGLEAYNELIVRNGGEPIVYADNYEDTIAAIGNMYYETFNERKAYGTELKQYEEGGEKHTEYVAAQEKLKDIQAALKFETYFSEDVYSELLSYIFEGEYNDEYIAITDSMESAEQFAQIELLYDRARAYHTKVQEPQYEFDVDVESFMFESKFKSWTDELEIGCIVNIDTNDGVVGVLLSSIKINFDDKNMKLSFGNKFNKFDIKSLYQKAIGDGMGEAVRLLQKEKVSRKDQIDSAREDILIKTLM